MARKKTAGNRKLALTIGLAVSVALLSLSLVSRDVYAAVVVVSPSNMQGWEVDDSSPTGFAEFVTGPATPPSGVGSARLFTGTDGNLAIALRNPAYIGIRLVDITALSHSAYAATANGSRVNQPYMYLRVMTGGGQDVLMFDPNAQATGADLNSWQNWNTKVGSWQANLKGSPGTIAQYITHITNFYGPTITIQEIKFQVGPAAQTDIFDGNVDNFTIGVSGGDITYDFEPDVVPTPTPSPIPTPTASPSPTPPIVPANREQCKNGGWINFDSPPFRNQGDCLRFVNQQN